MIYVIRTKPSYRDNTWTEVTYPDSNAYPDSGFYPIDIEVHLYYRILISTAISESGATSIVVGDTLRFNEDPLTYDLYGVVYITSKYLYLGRKFVYSEKATTIDWSSGMKQTFEFYEVDPGTWGDKTKLDNIKSCSITRDADTDTLASASIEADNLDGEMYIRIYMLAIQNGIKNKVCLGTFLAQTPSTSFDGKVSSTTVDCYSPLLELKEKQPPLGYTIKKAENIIQYVYQLTTENLRAPVTRTEDDKTLTSNFVAESDDTWMSFLSDLIANAEMSISLEPDGRIIFTKKQDLTAMTPTWEYNDDNSSILLPSLNIDRDLYGIPNVVEVIYSSNGTTLYSKVSNTDANSPISIPSRGREITYRSLNPSMYGTPNQEELDLYAETLLKELSTLEYTVTYSHGYCPVQLGDCVLLNYTRSGLDHVKAKVTKQTITCSTGCTVSETAVFSSRLWEG